MYSVAPFYNFPRQYLFGWSPLSGSISDESIFFVNIILILVNIWGQHGWVTAVEMGAVYTWHQIAPLSPWQTHLQLFQNNSNFENISLCTYYRWKLVIGHHRNLKIASQEKNLFLIAWCFAFAEKTSNHPLKIIPKMIWWQLPPLRGVCSNCNLSRVKFNKSCNFSIKHSEAILQFYPVERFR